MIPFQMGLVTVQRPQAKAASTASQDAGMLQTPDM